MFLFSAIFVVFTGFKTVHLYLKQMKITTVKYSESQRMHFENMYLPALLLCRRKIYEWLYMINASYFHTEETVW
jgi:hypothetical protein